MGVSYVYAAACPSRKKLQEMLTIAEKFAEEYKIVFITDILPENCIQQETAGLVRSPSDPVTLHSHGLALSSIWLILSPALWML